MGQVILCCGAYAKHPFFLKEECLNLYSAEELCYYVFENSYLLDDSFVSEKLADFIQTELQLPELAAQTRKWVGKKKSLGEFVKALFETTGYYEETQLKLTLQVVSSQDHLPIQEKKKTRADGYLKNKRYAMATDEYQALIRETEKGQERLLARIYHNLGVCAARQFFFKKAADYFKKAYDTYANTESYVQYLTALRMSVSHDAYLDFLSKNPQSYEDSLEVESRLKDMEQRWKKDETFLELTQLEQTRETDSSYYDQIDECLEEMKTEYKGSVSNSNSV